MRILMTWWLLAGLAPAVAASGFDAHYVAVSGDIDSDGDTDLFVQHVPEFMLLGRGPLRLPIALDRAPMADFLLRNENPAWQVETRLDSAQRSQLRDWPRLEQAQLVRADFNADAVEDLLIKRAPESAEPDIRSDILAFGPLEEGSGPIGATTVDAQFRESVDTLSAWLLDRSYFDAVSDPGRHVFVGNGLSYSDYAWLWNYCDRYYDYCYGRYGDLNLIVPILFGMACPSYVAGEGYWTGDPCRVGYHVWGSDEPIVRPDFTGTLPLVADVVTSVNSWISGTARMEDVTAQLERLLQAPVGGLDFSTVAAFDDLDETWEQQEFEFVSVIANLWHAFHGRPTMVDTVYLTAHPVLHVGPAHTALEYQYPAGTPQADAGPQLLSAGPISGRLVYGRNRKTDQGNFVFGRVRSPRYAAPRAHFDALTQAAENYDDDLDYDLFPELGDGYNSNSFVAGLLAVTESESDYPIHAFVGGGKPVPAAEFR